MHTCTQVINTLFYLRDQPLIGWTPLAEQAASCPTDSECGLRTVLFFLQALLFVVMFMNLLYYFRANLSFAVLVHILMTILVDILPFLLLLAVLWIGFSLALALLFQVAVRTSPQLRSEENGYQIMFPDQRNWGTFNWVYQMLNVGLYAHMDDGSMLLLQESYSIQVFFCIYMFIVHLVLLNMLIAIMQNS